MAGIYAGLGEKDHAFEWLHKAYEQGDFMQLKLDPFLDSLRSATLSRIASSREPSSLEPRAK